MLEYGEITFPTSRNDFIIGKSLSIITGIITFLLARCCAFCGVRCKIGYQGIREIIIIFKRFRRNQMNVFLFPSKGKQE